MSIMNDSGKLGSGECSFCGKDHKETKWLVAGPGTVKICDECIILCNDLVEEWEANDKDESSE